MDKFTYNAGQKQKGLCVISSSLVAGNSAAKREKVSLWNNHFGTHEGTAFKLLKPKRRRECIGQEPSSNIKDESFLWLWWNFNLFASMPLYIRHFSSKEAQGFTNLTFKIPRQRLWNSTISYLYEKWPDK